MVRYDVEYSYSVGNGRFQIGTGEFKFRHTIFTQSDVEELAYIIEACTGRPEVRISSYRALSVRIESDFI